MSRPPLEFFAFFARAGIDHFVETGTYKGGGVSTALRAGYKKVTSIEAVNEFHRNCSEKFEKEISEGRVQLLLGDSGEVMKNTAFQGPTVFWLDAHFQGEEAEFHADNCPLDRELDAVIQKRGADDVILIDDLRLLVDPKAWRGHDVKIERSIGRLLQAFPDHIAFHMDGHVPRDVFALIPARIAPAFFIGFPNAHSVSGTRHVEALVTQKPRNLSVYANGHNDRLGNILPLYGRLSWLAARLGRSLSFPFAERSISGVFERIDGTPFPKEDVSNHLNALLGRVIRSGEEVLEKLEAVAPYKYSPSLLHHVDFPAIGLRTLFSRGTVNMLTPESMAHFDTDLALIWKDPFPLTDIGGTTPAAISYLTTQLRVREDLRIETEGRRRSQFGGDLISKDRPTDLCLHIRQGDFRRWQDGVFFYEEDLVAKLITSLQTHFESAGRQVRITLLSDEPLPDSLLQPGRVEWFSSHFAGDFIRIAMSDIVLSNRSTFSESAALTGAAFFGNNSRYVSLGTARDALAAIQRLTLW